MMLDLDAIEARAEYKLAHFEGQGISLRDITWTLQDVLNLLAELRAAREVVACVPELIDWMERYRGVDNSLHPEEFYIRRDSARVALAAYRAVVGETDDPR